MTLENFARSTTFLGSYVASCWAIVLLWSRYITGGEITRNQCLSFSWIFGLFGLVERRSRQSELAQYILSHALYALYQRAKKARILSPKKDHRLVFTALLAFVGVGPWMGSKGKPGRVWRELFGTV